MMGRTGRLMVLAALAALVMASSVRAAEADRTLVTLEKLCPNCAKKITVKLKALPGVTSVESSAKEKVFLIVSKRDAQPSPRAIWETIEKGGEVPVKLEGPSGTFTAKP